MKKNNIILVGLAAMIATAGLLSGCNKQVLDTTYSYEKVVLSLPDGTIIDGKVQSWTDYSDGDQIQVKIDGKQYLVHSEDIVLISE